MFLNKMQRELFLGLELAGTIIVTGPLRGFIWTIEVLSGLLGFWNFDFSDLTLTLTLGL